MSASLPCVFFGQRRMAVSAIPACKADACSEEGVKPLREQPPSGAEPRAGLPSMASGVDALVSVGHFQRWALALLARYS